MTSKTTLELISLKGRGRAETIRLMLIYAGRAFEDTKMSIQQWKIDRKKKGFDEQTKLPVLRVNSRGNTKDIIGAVEIGRFIAVNCGLFGGSSSDQDLIENVIAKCEVLNAELAPIIRTTLTKNYDLRREYWNEFKEHHLNPALLTWDTELATRNHLIGTTYSWADICVIEMLTRFQTCYDSFFMASWRNLKGLIDRFESIPTIKLYVQNRPDSHF